MIKTIAYRAGVPKFHAHAARHWCGTTLISGTRGKKIDIREVQIHLGHASLISTQIYTHLQERRVAQETSEKMDEYFREGRIKMEKIQIPLNPTLNIMGPL